MHKQYGSPGHVFFRAPTYTMPPPPARSHILYDTITNASRCRQSSLSFHISIHSLSKTNTRLISCGGETDEEKSTKPVETRRKLWDSSKTNASAEEQSIYSRSLGARG